MPAAVVLASDSRSLRLDGFDAQVHAGVLAVRGVCPALSSRQFGHHVVVMQQCGLYGIQRELKRRRAVRRGERASSLVLATGNGSGARTLRQLSMSGFCTICGGAFFFNLYELSLFIFL